MRSLVGLLALFLDPTSSLLAHIAPRAGAPVTASSSRPLLLPRAAAPLAAPRCPAAVALSGDDADMNAYRALGLAEDATYDEIMDAFMSLSETYAEDPGKLLVRAAPEPVPQAKTRRS